VFSSTLVFLILALGVLGMAGAAAGAIRVGRSDDERNAAFGKK
jgi:uncharacterized membrane protein YtjA (UPF0391 family)